MVICLFGEKVKEIATNFSVIWLLFPADPSLNAGRGRREERPREREERGESRFFFIKIIGWEALLLPNQKTQN